MNLSLLAALATSTALSACHHDTASPTAEPTAAAQAPEDRGQATPAEPTVAEAALADGKVTRSEYDAIVATTRASLARLQELHIVEVGALIVDAPSAAMRCYGPCAGDPEADAYMLAHAKQTRRLEELVEVASGIQAKPSSDDVSRVSDALASLRALEIVEIGGTFAEPGRCYSIGCPEAIAATVALADAMKKR